MLNYFPMWKNILIILTILVATVYALPNLYGSDPSVQISPLRKAVLDDAKVNQIKQTLKQKGITWKSDELKDSHAVIAL